MAPEPPAAASGVPPLRLSRVFAAPRDLVFAAWGSTEHVKQWFCPDGFTVPEATVTLRVGGRFEVCMRWPDDTTEHWTRGVFVEVVPGERLVVDMTATDADGRRLLRAWTEVTFADVPGGTRMDVVQTYTLEAPEAEMMVQGAPQGWSQTLDRLAALLLRMQPGDAVRSVVHGMFTLHRTYAAPLARVFRAFSDLEAKRRWFSGDAGQWEELERRMDFRMGGREFLSGRWASGTVTAFDAIYHDIVAGERVVYSYEMNLDGRKISVSLATVEVKPDGAGGTRLTVTEQGAFLDGYDDAGSREQGTGFLLDRLGATLHD